MNGIINLLLGIFAIGNVAYHLTQKAGMSGKFFGVEVSSTVYCLIWGALGVYFLSAFFRMKKRSKQN